ncbi:MAG: LamB/YcsF family protein [Reyranellaceae bacterium]
MARGINLNADLGESFGPWPMGNDAAMLGIVKSANVACGFHAGDPTVMTETVRLAKANGVSIGAHPSFPDLQGFGRRQMKLSTAELEALIAYQTGALMGVAAAQGMTVTHVKPHGALSNMASVDAAMAEAIARAIRAVDRDLIFLATAGSEMAKAGRRLGLTTAQEIFADRTYGDDGNLTPRAQPNAMIHDAQQAVAHVRRMVEEQAIFSLSGRKIPTPVDSICVHGDEESAVAVARAVREGLEQAQIRILPLPEVMAR